MKLSERIREQHQEMEWPGSDMLEWADEIAALEQVNANLHEVIDGLEERLLSVLEVAVARGERLGYADEDYRETLAQGDDGN